MKRLFSLIALLLFFATQLSAQITITVGDENSGLIGYCLLYPGYSNSLCEVVYLSSELLPGEISSISYQYGSSTSFIDPNPHIYMAEVSRTSFSNIYDWETEAMTEVYSGGSITYNQGWNTIELTTPFFYSGNGNLVVVYKSQMETLPEWSWWMFNVYQTSDFQMLMNYDNNYSPLGVVPDGTSGHYGMSMSRPNTKFTINLEESFCLPLRSATVSSLSPNQATISWNRFDAQSSTFGLEYKPAESDDWIFESSSITDTFYVLSDLSSLTDYDFRVYTVCSENISSYCVGEFSTFASEEDCFPIPHKETFNDEDELTNWRMLQGGENAWYVGDADNIDVDALGNPVSGGSLYISSTNGDDASYDNTIECISYAYTYVSLQAGNEYGLQFAWKGGDDVFGNNRYRDYLSVYLLPEDYELSTNSLPSTGVVLASSLGGASSWQQKSMYISDRPTGVYKLVFAWYNNNNGYGSVAAEVDDVYFTDLGCKVVDSIRVAWTNEIESVSAEVSVFSNNNYVSYLLEYKTEEDAEWNSVNSMSPMIINNLMHNTKYYFRATPICDNSEYSILSQEWFFISPCQYAEIPYFQGFDDEFVTTDGVCSNTSTLPCWYNINGGSNGSYFSRRSEYTLSGAGSLFYRGRLYSGNNPVFSDWLISPVFNLTGNEQLSYSICFLPNPSIVQPAPIIDIFICDVSSEDIASMSDTSRFTLVRSINHAGLGNTYQEAVAVLSEYVGPMRIAIAVRNDTGSFAIDNWRVSTIPPCPPIYDFSAVASSESSVAISYYSMNITEAGVTIAYQETGGGTPFNPATATLLTVEQGAYLPIIISGLTPGGTYTFAMKQSCEGGFYGSPVSVSLPLSTELLPYVQNFDVAEEEHGFTFVGTDVNVWTVGNAANNTTNQDGELVAGGRALYVSNDNGISATYTATASATCYAISPAISFGEADNFLLSFDYKVGGDSYDNLSVYLLPYGEGISDVYRIMMPTYSYQPSWKDTTMILSSDYSDGIYQLVFYWTNDQYGGSQLGAIIDNISINAMHCDFIHSVSATLVEEEDGGNPQEIIIDITDNNSDLVGATYILKYRTSQDEDFTVLTDLLPSDFPYTLTPVEHSTKYTIEAASVCPDGLETPFVQTTLIVPCGINSVPWTEDFSRNLYTIQPSCWTRVSGTVPESGIIQTPTQPSTANFTYENSTIGTDYVTALRVNMSGNRNEWLISPSIDLEDGSTTYGLSFNMMRLGPVISDPNVKFIVLFSTDNGLTWDMADAHIYGNEDENANFHLSDVGGSWIRQIVKLVDQENNPFEGNIKFAFHVASSSIYNASYLLIDDIAIEQWADCLQPQNLALTGLGPTTADISFTELGSSTQWEYVLTQGENTTPDSGTPVAFSQASVPLHLEGLSPQTTYTLAIRSNCSGNYSDWSEAIVFTTYSAVASIPYSTDFEDETENATWNFGGFVNVNAWAIGSATFAGEEASGHSAYISSNGGQSYGATYGYQQIYSYMWKDFDFGTGEDVFELSFDWKGIGAYYSATTIMGGLAVLVQDPDDPVPSTINSPFPSQVVIVLYNGTDWANARVVLPQLSGVKRLIFYSWGLYSTPERAATPPAIDNILIDVPVCPAPYSLIATNQTQTTADLFWEGIADSYIIQYKSSSDTEFTTVTTSDNQYTLTELEPTKRYVLSIQGVCGTDLSIVSDSLVFKTSCYDEPIIEYPYEEGFEENLDCWNVINTLPNASWAITSNGNYSGGPHSGNGMAAFTYYYQSSASSTLISPAFYFYGEMQLSFWMFKAPNQNTNNNRLEVYANNVSSEIGATLLTSIVQDGTYVWEEVQINIPDTMTGPHYLIFKASTDVTSYIFIDDMTLSVIGGSVPCDAPSELSAVAVGSSSATLSWSGEVPEYEVRLNNGNISTLSDTTISYTNLAPETDYTFKVRAVCGNNMHSEWVTVLFTTLERENEIVPPSVVTLAATEITNEGATLHGTIVAGSEEITDRGFKYRATGSTAWETIPAVGNAMTATLHYLNPSTAYEYTAFATTPSGTTEGATISFTTMQMGLNSAESTSHSITIYPNPASRSVTISAGGVESGAKIVVSDMQGRIILSDNMTSETYELSVANMTSGVYYIRVIGTTSTYTQKLIVE